MTCPRLLAIGALALAACADSTDERPATLEYITSTILAPSCATATCHNAMTRRQDYEFDTLEGARASMLKDLVPIGGASPDEVQFTKLHLVLTADAGAEFNSRMPVDSPLPDADVELIDRWIGEGAVGL